MGYTILTKKRLLLLIPLLIIMAFVSTSVCYANAGPPPSILIIVPNAPADLEISIGNTKANRTDKVIESYYAFYSRDLKSTYYTVNVTTKDHTFEIILDAPLESYNNIFTLDLERQTLTPGESLSRSISLTSIRVILTLIIEGIVFFLFGYRKKKSWLIFLILNLVTQGYLNIWLDNTTTPLESYIVLTLIVGEILVFIVEMLALLIFVREHGRLRIASYVITANLLSLIAGGYLITVLPV
ncbi:hypothetical protein ACFLWE_00935 [Chloroflexota bacterium]